MRPCRRQEERRGDHDRVPASPTASDHRPAPESSVRHTGGCSFIRKETVTSHANTCVNHEEPADTARLQEGVVLRRPREQASAGRHRRRSEGGGRLREATACSLRTGRSPSVSLGPAGTSGSGPAAAGRPGRRRPRALPVVPHGHEEEEQEGGGLDRGEQEEVVVQVAAVDVAWNAEAA